ncbi:hypothetical protein JYK02_05980 [Corallococcus macrosporus]|uniref:Uncharacterized protein n=1 Tax=Corallococcus macrosporus TaxID=35 RepID=A0ABS3D8R8_9BACT|nr:hypothetical protein [Corallococcus macrosporus]MBN8227057.1 hypothetical protein [Corallococcus macrosporus]
MGDMHFIQIETSNERLADDVKYSVLSNKLARTVTVVGSTRSFAVEHGIKDSKAFVVTFQTEKLEEIKAMMQDPTMKYASMAAWETTA